MLNDPKVALSEQAVESSAPRGGRAPFRLDLFIKNHRPRVYALAKAILKQHEWAEDATQETLLRVVQHIESGMEKDDASAWVLCITRNVSISMWRKLQRRGEVEFDSVEIFDRAPRDDDATPLDLAIDREDARRVAAAMEHLPGPLREVLILRFYHGLEPREMAKVLDVSDENARVRLWRAIRELRIVLNVNKKNIGGR